MSRTSLSRPCLLTLATLALAGCASHGKEARLRYGKIPPDAYAVVAEVHAKPGKAEQLRKATLPLVAEVRKEPHNRLYFLHEDRQTPGHFTFYEIFASQADFDAHNATPHVQRWFAQLPELAEGGVTVTRMKILGNEPWLAK